MIVIVDYQMGNLASVYNSFIKNGFYDVKISSDPEEISKASKLVLPGVGAYEDAMKNLKSYNLVDVIKTHVIKEKKPLLGICLGFQLLFERSYENGCFDGLALLKGEFIRFENIDMPVPHMGWNTVKFTKESKIFKGIKDNSYFYFDHSYYLPYRESAYCAGITNYKIDFVSCISDDLIFGTQFHPEKSHENGLKIIKNFIEY